MHSDIVAAATPPRPTPDETTLGGRIHAIRVARGRQGRPQVLKRFLESMNLLLHEHQRVLRQTVVERWEKNLASPSFAQGVAIAKLDPLVRGCDWLAGIRNVSSR